MINWNASSVEYGTNATEAESLFTALPFGNTATAHTTHILVAKTNRPSPPLGALGFGGPIDIMGNNYYIEYNFENCSEETVEIVEALVKGRFYDAWTEGLEEDATLFVERKMRGERWKEDERFMRLVLRVLLPGETVLVEANDEYGVYGEDDAGMPVPWVGTLADYVERFFE